MKLKRIPLKHMLFVPVIALGLLIAGCSGVREVSTEETYAYTNPDETKAETDTGFVIDGVLDEAAYQQNNWLYLSNREGGADVEIAMTSYFGEKGMYFVYDVTESNPIYVNLNRPSYLNSGVELHLAPGYVSKMKANSVFEINLLPSGDMTFKKSDGKGSFVNVETTKDMMALLGATTKGGQLNTDQCYGYCLELFIPWEYMEKFDLDVAAMKSGHVHAGLAHITSFNYAGTDMDVDRYWYSFDVQHGASWSDVYQYFRFDENGAQGTVPVELSEGEHYTISGATAVIPGMQMNVTVTPETGYALNSILINEEEYIEKAQFNEDGSVTIRERGVSGGVKISAAAVPVTDGNKTLTGTVKANKLGGGSLRNVSASYKGPTGERPLELDNKGNFTLTDLKQGYYTIILEQAGYKKLEHSVFVNRDMEVQLSLEYDLFTATGHSWVLDNQNDGVLYKFGGSGELLTNDSYKKFTASATFHFDKEVEKSGTTDHFQQQRQGFKFVFSNDKTWHVDLVKEDGKYYVQYAKHSGDKSMTGWKKIYTLTDGEVAKYTGKQGVSLSVQKDGKYANVYLDGKVIAMEILDEAYASATVKIGFEAWAANREITQIPYKITPTADIQLYNQFTVEARFLFDKVLEKAGKTAAFTEQRQGIKIVFSNGKVWHIDLLKQKGAYFVQYAKHSGDNSMTGWKKIYTLTEEEIAKFTGEKGVCLSVQRDGKYANVYLDGKLIALEILEDACASASAQIALETWVAQMDVKDIPCEIAPSTAVNLQNTMFKMAKGWDVSQQYNGLVALSEGGYGKLSFMEKQGNMNLTLKVRDYKDSADAEGTYPRTDLLFVFDNGKQISFGIDMKGNRVQSVFDDKAPEKDINTGWKTWGSLTAEEVALLQAEGVDFKVIRYGTEVTLYIGNRMVAVADLTANGSGVTADMQATVSIRHYDDAGVRVEIPFALSNTYDLVTVTTDGNLTAEKQQYFAGDTVKIRPSSENNYIVSMKVNGETVPVHWNGTYSFTAEEKEYTVTGEVTKSVFKIDDQWNLQKQNENVISIPVRTGNYAGVDTTDSTYRDAAVLVKDYAPTDTDGKGNFQMQIRFQFANGKEYQVRLHNTNKVDTYEIQSMGGESCISGWKWHKDLTAAQMQKLRKEGVQFRVVLVDTTAMFYLDGVAIGTYDLTGGFRKNDLKTDAVARIRFVMYGNQGVENISIPYALGAEPKTVTVSATDIANGTVTSNPVHIVGEKVVLKATPDAGYNLTGLVVKKNGTAVQVDTVDQKKGTYSFVAEDAKYTVEATFTEKIFQDASNWDLTGQYDGIVTLLKGYEKGRTLKTQANSYRDAAVTVKHYKEDTFKAELHFVFAEGKEFQIRLHNENTNGEYRVQKMGTTLSSGWKNLYTLEAAEVEALKSEGIQFRVEITGAKAIAYIGDKQVGEVDLSGKIAGEKAQIKILLYGNDGVENIEIPFTLGSGPAVSTVAVAEGIANGEILVDKTVFVEGETVTITAKPAKGYGLKCITVKKDDQPWKTFLPADAYVFEVSGESSYTVEAEFAPQIFQDTEYYDLSNQYNGFVTIKKGYKNGRTLKTEENIYRDVTVTVTHYTQDTFKAELHFAFAEGKEFQIRLHNEGTNGEYRVQKMGTSLSSGWSNLYTLTDAQVSQLKESGVQFRVAIVDTTVFAYINGVKVGEVDLFGKITTENAQIKMVMYGNDGVENIEIPFHLGSGPVVSTVTVAEGIANGEIQVNKTDFVSGETVTVTAFPAEGYNLKCITVKKDGQPVTTVPTKLTGGAFSFEIPGSGSYTVEAEFAESVFTFQNDAERENWDVEEQYNGAVTLLKGYEKGRTLRTLANGYRDVAVTVKHYTEDTFKAELHLVFGEGKEFQIRLHNENTGGAYKVQKMATDLSSGWSNLYTLTNAQVSKLKESGVQFRVAIVDTTAFAYIDGVQVGQVDLSGKITTETAQVKLVMYGNDGVENIEIPITLGGSPAVSAVTVAQGIVNGQIQVGKTQFIAGETVTITATPNAGSSLKELRVKKDGQEWMNFLTQPAGGAYTFVAAGGCDYTVEADFTVTIFGATDTKNTWDLSNQENGSITIVSKTSNEATVTTAAQAYREVSVTVRDHTPSLNGDGSLKKGNFSVGIYFIFDDGKEYRVRLHNTDSNGLYKLQNMGGNNSLVGWLWQADLTAAQMEKVMSEEGVAFSVKLVGSDAELWVDGSKLKTVDLPDAYADKLAKIKIAMNGNNDTQNIVIPFVLG